MGTTHALPIDSRAERGDRRHPDRHVPAMTYRVRLEQFEGPFDLLLHLISRRKLEVTDVDLSEITADYLAGLDDLDAVDLETATQFLVVAATLVELKAARLLPSDEREELEDLLDEARDVLYARLLEYRAFRDAAAVLRDRLERHAGHHARTVDLDPDLRRLAPPTRLPVGAEGLARLAARADARRPPAQVDVAHIRRTYLTIREAAGEVLRLLETAAGRRTFGELAGDRSRADRVVLFLSLLELYKVGALDLDQDGSATAPLHVRRRDVPADLDALVGDQPGAHDPSASQDVA